MTVSNSIGYVEYTATGATDLFTIPFPFLDDGTNIHVYDVTNGVAAKTEYVQGTDYAVTGIPSNPKVDFVVAPGTVPSPVSLLIRRELPITQLADYLATGVFPAESHELALDKLTMICQDLLARVELGDFDFSAFMTQADGAWDAQGLVVSNGSPALEDDDLPTLAQVLAIISGTTPVPINGLHAWEFMGDGATISFSLTTAFDYSAEDFIVTINGVVQHHGVSYSYTVINSGSSSTPDLLLFTTAPASGDRIVVRIPTGTALVEASSFVIDNDNIPDLTIMLSKLEAGTPGQFIKCDVAGTWYGDNIVAADVANFAAAVQALAVNTLAAASGSLNMNSNKIVSLAAGTASGDAVNKGQLDAVTPFSRQTGAVSWSTGTGSWTATIDFPFSVGFLGLDFTGTVGGSAVANTASFFFHGNGTAVHSTASGLSISATRSTISGGTRITLATNIGTASGTALTGVGNNPYFGAQGNA